MILDLIAEQEKNLKDLENLKEEDIKLGTRLKELNEMNPSIFNVKKILSLHKEKNKILLNKNQIPNKTKNKIMDIEKLYLAIVVELDNPEAEKTINISEIKNKEIRKEVLDAYKLHSVELEFYTKTLNEIYIANNLYSFQTANKLVKNSAKELVDIYVKILTEIVNTKHNNAYYYIQNNYFDLDSEGGYNEKDGLLYLLSFLDNFIVKSFQNKNNYDSVLAYLFNITDNSNYADLKKQLTSDKFNKKKEIIVSNLRHINPFTIIENLDTTVDYLVSSDIDSIRSLYSITSKIHYIFEIDKKAENLPDNLKLELFDEKLISTYNEIFNTIYTTLINQIELNIISQKTRQQELKARRNRIKRNQDKLKKEKEKETFNEINQIKELL